MWQKNTEHHCSVFSFFIALIISCNSSISSSETGGFSGCPNLSKYIGIHSCGESPFLLSRIEKNDE